jgi:hypothetical protein
MKTRILLVFLFLSIAQTVYSDGMAFPRDPTAYYSITEDQQIAVIDVQDAQNINIDMFISLTDSSTGQSNEIDYFLPFYNKPGNFQVEETNYTNFAKNRTKPLDDLIEADSNWKDDSRRNIVIGAAIGWMTAGGPTVLSIPLLSMGVFNVGKGNSAGMTMGIGGGGSITPEEIITTEHSRTEVYNVSSNDDLEALLLNTQLANEAKQKIRDYKGTYIYHITLKTIPKTTPVTGVDDSGYGYNDYNRGGLNSLGMHFSFKTAPKNGLYTYPLSTGKTWNNPIKLTRVYVKNSRQTSLDITYPKIGDKAGYYDYYQLTSSSYDEDRSTKWDYASAEDSGSIVSRISYLTSNPDQDIMIKISGNDGASALIGSLIALSRPLLTIAVPLLLVILPFVLWLAFFNRLTKRIVSYQTKYKMTKHAILYFVLNSFIQTSLTWMTIMGLVVAYIVFMLMISQMHYDEYGGLTQYVYIVFLIVLIPIFLIQILIGSTAVAFIYKLHNKLNKLPYARFFAIYMLTLVIFFAVAAAAYFIV